jgi:uncharacterized protein DUF4249
MRIYIFVRNLFLLITSILFISACEEVIEIDLNSSDPRIVIEGTVTDQPGSYQVLISKTADYYDQANYPAVSGAQVTISDDNGFSEELIETAAGIYQTDSLQGTQGRTYTLTAIVEGQTFGAESTMPVALEIDSLYYNISEGGVRQRDKEGFELVCNFRDHPQIEDFGRLKVYRNNELVDGYFVYNGRLSDGNVIEYDRIRTDLKLNDFVKVELHSIDEPTYEFYSTIGNASASTGSKGRIQTKTPANPETNLTGGALGYFGVFTVRTDSLWIN